MNANQTGAKYALCWQLFGPVQNELLYLSCSGLKLLHHLM
jgi:hypothetical protein